MEQIEHLELAKPAETHRSFLRKNKRKNKFMCKETKILSESEYQGIPFDLHQKIQVHVNQEEKKWYTNSVIELPKFEKIKVENYKPGWANFFIILKKGMRELRP